ncbi:hypothetical protein GGS21DRAFT_488219 [Xylaria nigripes]|nr:hypothetical protein GGS21DRAFT_488219 [Xylaria nigripes]
MEVHGNTSKYPMGSVAQRPLEQIQQLQLPQPHPSHPSHPPHLPHLPHPPHPPHPPSNPSQPQQQLSAAQRSTPPRQYTTVGSVYNPQPQPLQPPVRRGRTVKTLFPYKSESPVGPSQLQYTPLQQNSDRAVSPVRFNTDSLPSTMTITHQERQILQKFGVAIPNVQQTSHMPRTVESPICGSANALQCSRTSSTTNNTIITDSITAGNSATFSHAIAESDNGSDSADTKPISAMNFNSLTNLASYPNPMQRAAQKVLASHRPQPNPGPGPQASGSLSANYNTEVESWMSPIESSMPMPPAPRVRGAPAPLTAGPPGVRQFRPTTFDQETLQRVREFDDENPMMNPYHLYLPSGHHIRGPSMGGGSVSSVPTARTLDDCDVDDVEGNYNKRKNDDRVVDTLPTDEARNYYPDGLPPNFNLNTQPISSDWAVKHRLKVEFESNLYLIQRRDGFWAQRSCDINNHFYSGHNRFNNKDFGMAASEHGRCSLDHNVDHSCKEPPNDQGKANSLLVGVRDRSLNPASNK